AVGDSFSKRPVHRARIDVHVTWECTPGSLSDLGVIYMRLPIGLFCLLMKYAPLQKNMTLVRWGKY
ncbi:hypothetical protein ACVBEF_13100, partial [Glaciimonas sp. GG7]